MSNYIKAIFRSVIQSKLLRQLSLFVLVSIKSCTYSHFLFSYLKKYVPVWLRIRSKSAGLIPVLNHTMNHLSYCTTDNFPQNRKKFIRFVPFRIARALTIKTGFINTVIIFSYPSKTVYNTMRYCLIIIKLIRYLNYYKIIF